MSITVSDTQSLVQLSVALNFAFAAFESLRAPVESKMRRLADDGLRRSEALTTELGTMHYMSTLGWPVEIAEQFRSRSSDYSKASLHAHNLRGYDTAYQDSNDGWSFWIGRFAVFVGVVGLALLFASPFEQPAVISEKLYLAISLFLYLPSIILVFYNLAIGGMMREEISRISEMRKEIEEIEQRLKDQYRPVVIRAKKEGYLK